MFSEYTILLAVFLISLMICDQSEALTLVDNGKSDYVVVLSESASASEKTGADELITILHQISGVKLPLVTGKIPSGKKAVVIGDGQVLKSLKTRIDFKSLGDEGFCIRTIGDHIVIAGGRLRGSMYGVYRFLETQLGCRFYTAYISHILQKSTIKIKHLNIREKPSFEYRDMWFRAAQDSKWGSRNMVNGHHTDIGEAHGGSIRYGLWVHTFDMLLSSAIYYEEHPEYYALVDGKRLAGAAGQPCLTNPDVLAIVTENVLKIVESDPGSKLFSVSQNDNYNYCRCPQCAKVDEEEGSHIGALIRFVNAVADKVAEKRPDVFIDTLAYQYTEAPPLITKPRDNVIIRLCAGGKCQFHEYEKCERNAEFVEHLKVWHTLTPNLYIWHYLSNFGGGHIAPWHDLGQIPSTMKLLEKQGVKGVFLQGCIHCGGNEYGEGAWMMDLKAYLGAKLLWNVNADAKAIRQEFLTGFYGNAGKPIGKLLDYLDSIVKNENIHGMEYQGIGAFNIMPWTSLEFRQREVPQATWGFCENDLLTPEVMKTAHKYFDEAKRVADNAEILARVKNSELGVDYVDVMRKVDQAVISNSKEDKLAALADLTDLCNRFKANGIKLLVWDIDNQYEGLKNQLQTE